MHATLEQQIAYLDEQVTALRSDVERLQALVSRSIALSEGAPAKRGPGRPRKSGPESEPVTFGDAARATDG
jgi:hypothetical protein